MTKRDLVVKIAKETNIIQSDVATVVQLVLNNLASELMEGKSVELRNFGIFEVKVHKKRVGRNPNTPNKPVTIPERVMVKFRAGKELKDEVAKLLPENIK